MTIVTHELDKINNSYKRFYQKLIPCNCEVCKTSQNPNFYTFETLKKFHKHRQKEIQCQESFEMVNVLQLIDDVIDQSKIPEQETIRPGNYTIKAEHIDIKHIYVEQPTIGMTNQPPPDNFQPKVKLPWLSGMFYLLMFEVVFISIAIFAGKLPIYSLILVVIATILIIVLIGVLQLRQDERLSDESTVELIKMVFEQLPVISNLIEKLKGDS